MKSNNSWMKASLLQPTTVLFGEYSTTSGLLQHNGKSTQIIFLFVITIFTIHVPNCVSVVWLYTFSLIFVFIVAINCSFAALGNNCFEYT